MAYNKQKFKSLLGHIRKHKIAGNSISLKKTGCTYEDIVELMQALAANTTIINLNLEFNQIGAAGAQALAANTTISTLNLNGNQIGDAGAQYLAANTTITNLGLAGNQIGAAGAQALAANTTITNLNLSLNQIGDAGAQYLAANTTITNLGLAGNQIGAAGALELKSDARLFNNMCFGYHVFALAAANSTPKGRLTQYMSLRCKHKGAHDGENKRLKQESTSLPTLPVAVVNKIGEYLQPNNIHTANQITKLRSRNIIC